MNQVFCSHSDWLYPLCSPFLECLGIEGHAGLQVERVHTIYRYKSGGNGQFPVPFRKKN